MEKAVIAAREEAEDAARAALDVLAVNQQRAFETLTSEQRVLRNALRAKARQLSSGSQSAGFALLVEEVAYVQWHRMLFPLFLAENDLLMHPIGVAVTLEDCEELAPEEGDPDRWATAARYAGNMLPGIFPSDDPSGQVTFAPEGRAALEAILSTLPRPVLTSDDGLGWVYQFWQSKKKKEVSGSGRKIEKLDLAAYSQLFTEDYMVRFLLENSLGAWWASRHPNSPLVKGFKLLRFREDGTPATGAFTGWPTKAADVAVMDPCCGSGHFLVVAFEMLRRMRMEEEGLGETGAADAVLRDNLFGLEIDPRCVQIAAFSLALAAWKAGGYRDLPLPSIACSGIPVSGQLEVWTRLAGDDTNMRQTLDRLHGLFVNAPDLGSLIDPMSVPIRERMFTPDFSKVAPLLEGALAKERAEDPVAAVFGSAALGVARAAELLARQYTLVATNVPYLKRGSQGNTLRVFTESQFPESKADLATVFIDRCISLLSPQGTCALVATQYWLFLGSYRRFRQRLLKQKTWSLLARLGARAFETISGEVVNVALFVIGNQQPTNSHLMPSLDVTDASPPQAKSSALRDCELTDFPQSGQLRNPDARVITEQLSPLGPSLAGVVDFGKGSVTGDSPHYIRKFWEIDTLSDGYEYWLNTPTETSAWQGRSEVVLWSVPGHNLTQERGFAVRGHRVWGKKGVAVAKAGKLTCTLYEGEKFDDNLVVLVPRKDDMLPSLWAFCQSDEFRRSVRALDSKLGVTVGTFVKVSVDMEFWQKAASPLPSVFSNDPTQWLFWGNLAASTEPLQVAVARLLGYQWPQTEADGLSRLALPDGILPLASLAGQEPAVERLRRVLAVSYGNDWSVEQQMELLRQVGFGDKGLDAWLRDGFFEQHCRLFHQRPFVWHIWDCRRDGFSVLVNYHKLDAANLNKLIYTYLGEWIRTQRSAEESGTPGASARLVAALELQRKLENIRDGEPPYDIYVRWKPLRELPIGWNTDLNDGVRLNIRPFIRSGVLRSRVNVNWKKDRGRNADGSERINDLIPPLTLAEKRAAREAKTT